MGNRIAFALFDWHHFPRADYVVFCHTDTLADNHCFADADRVPIADCLAYTCSCRIERAERR